MANLDEVLKDPDFWGPDTTDEDRKWTLGKVDKKFGGYSQAEQDKFIKNLTETRKKSLESNQKEAEVRAPVVQEGLQKQQTWWESAVRPLTEGVGQAMEMATTPAVPLARLLQGEGLESFNPRGMVNTLNQSGAAKQSRETAAAGVVPQSPWQAGAMGAQFVPGVGPLAKAGMVGRVAKSALGAGGLQGLLGERGLVEGGSMGEVASEAGIGTLKGGATQAVGEGIGLGIGARRRLTPGAGAKAADLDAKSVTKAAGEIAPEFAGAKGSQEAGAFYTGTHGAKKAASGAFRERLSLLEQELNSTQGHPFINSPELGAAYGQLYKQMGKDPVLVEQMAALKPTPGMGFLPEQAAKIISLTGQRLGANQTGLGHLKDQAMDDLVAAVERTLPASAKGMLSGARGGYAKASGLQELLGPAFDPGKGFQFSIKRVQEALSKDPSFLERLGPGELEKLFLAVTRGASKGPGYADVASKGGLSTPYHMTPVAGLYALLRNLSGRGSTVGKHPLSLQPGTKAGMGVATTAASSVANRARREE